jgi:hypothetical protein
MKSAEVLARLFERSEVNKPDHRHRRLLRAGSERRGEESTRNAANEPSPIHH